MAGRLRAFCLGVTPGEVSLSCLPPRTPCGPHQVRTAAGCERRRPRGGLRARVINSDICHRAGSALRFTGSETHFGADQSGRRSHRRAPRCRSALWLRVSVRLGGHRVGLPGDQGLPGRDPMPSRGVPRRAVEPPAPVPRPTPRSLLRVRR